MNQESPNSANSESGNDPKLARALAGWAAFKNPLVWGAYAAQIAGFILLFFVFFPAAQPRLILILGYVLPTMFFVRKLHNKVAQQIMDARSTVSAPA